MLKRLKDRDTVINEAGDPDAVQPKDRMRVSDIAKKAGLDPEKMMRLAQTMAKLITDPHKALRRGRAARDARYEDIAQVFFDRAEALGLAVSESERASRG